MEEPIRKFLKDQIGITNEELNKLSPGMEKLLSAIPELIRWKIIAEVTDAEYCLNGCKVGDKLVFQGGTLIAEESTCPLCMGAIAPLLERMHIMWDRIADGRDTNDVWVRHSQCYDPGLEHGGLGRVVFKVYAEKVG